MVFKISACFEVGASIHQVAQKTGYSIEQLNKFVTVGLLTHVLGKIPAESAKLILEEKPTSGALRGFFGKLRMKLGI